jgi:hypothetical protein
MASVDGKPIDVELIGSRFPSVDAVRPGEGDALVPASETAAIAALTTR